MWTWVQMIIVLPLIFISSIFLTFVDTINIFIIFARMQISMYMHTYVAACNWLLLRWPFFDVAVLDFVDVNMDVMFKVIKKSIAKH